LRAKEQPLLRDIVLRIPPLTPSVKQPRVLIVHTRSPFGASCVCALRGGLVAHPTRRDKVICTVWSRERL
jgi:hypothetical protein